MVRVAASITAALALMTGAAGCTPVSTQHGWIADSQSKIDIQPGVDTKSTVLARMGTPSTQGFLEANDWYYITTVQETYAFYHPKTQNREVMVVRFAQDDTVAAVDKFGMDRGRVVSYSPEKTPTRGRELSIVEQLLGNVGTKAPFPTDERSQNPDRR